MNKNMRPNEFLKSHNCVIEPIDKVFEEIKTNNSKKIIVTGGRGVGKTLVLSNCDKKTKNTSNPIIFTRFDSVGLFSKGLDYIFNKEFYEHYYEIIMSYKLLNYVKEQCKVSDRETSKYRKLVSFEDKLNAYDKKLINYINNICYDEDVYLPELLSTKELTEGLLEIVKDSLDLENVSLAIDRFDWTNSNNRISQEVLSKYFDMFSKVIITSDDNSLFRKEEREKLNKKGYAFIDVTYGKEPIIVKKIVKNKIEQCNQNIRNLEFNYQNISEDIYQEMIDKTKGNINMILHTASYAYDTYQWECGEWDVDRCLLFALDVKVNDNKKLSKIMNPPKLYL